MTSYKQFKEQITTSLENQMRMIWLDTPYATHLFDDQPLDKAYVARHQSETLQQLTLLRELYIITNAQLIEQYDIDTKKWSDYIIDIHKREYAISRELKNISKK